MQDIQRRTVKYHLFGQILRRQHCLVIDWSHMPSAMVKLVCTLFAAWLALPAGAATILVMGDSLSAGYGLQPGQGWVSLLQQDLEPKHRIINASISGETSDGGLARLPDALSRHKPDIVVLELGANDGLRGLPLSGMERNLQQMITCRARPRPGWCWWAWPCLATMARNTPQSSARCTTASPNATSWPTYRCWWPALLPTSASSSLTGCTR
jgi:hypothetical protein